MKERQGLYSLDRVLAKTRSSFEVIEPSAPDIIGGQYWELFSGSTGIFPDRLGVELPYTKGENTFILNSGTPIASVELNEAETKTETLLLALKCLSEYVKLFDGYHEPISDISFPEYLYGLTNPTVARISIRFGFQPHKASKDEFHIIANIEDLRRRLYELDSDPDQISFIEKLNTRRMRESNYYTLLKAYESTNTPNFDQVEI